MWTQVPKLSRAYSSIWPNDMQPTTLSDYLARYAGETELAYLIERIASACWSISQLVGASALHGNLGASDQINTQREVQKPLDILADEVFARSARGNSGACCERRRA